MTMRSILILSISLLTFNTIGQEIKPLVFRLTKGDTAEVDNLAQDGFGSASQMFWQTDLQPATLQSRTPVYASVDLSNSGLRTVPFDYCAHNWMSSYNFEGNNIRKIGQRFGKVSTDTLFLANNAISNVKRSGLFRRLVYLDLSNNRIEKIPVDWTGMYRLTHLDLSYNRINDLSALFAPPAAEIILLEGNAISNLPRRFKDLKSLYQLDLGDNNIKYIPKSLAKLPRLEVLDLSDNHIKKIPSFAHRMNKLRTLDLSGNPLELDEVDRLRKSLPDCEVIFN